MGLTIHPFSEEKCNTWGARVLQKNRFKAKYKKGIRFFWLLQQTHF
jgi:hypothetical protein